MPSKNSIFVDTAGWGHYLDRAQPLHQAALSVVQKINKRKGRLITTNYVINELVVLLERRMHFPRKRLIQVVNQVLSSPFVNIIHIDETQHRAAWAMLEKYDDKEWSLVDAASFVVMQQFGLTEALTTDHHFSQASFVRLPEMQP